MKSYIIVLALFLVIGCKKKDCDINLTDLSGNPLPKDIVILYASNDTAQIGNNSCKTIKLNHYTLSSSISKIDMGDKKVSPGAFYSIQFKFVNGDQIILMDRKKIIQRYNTN